MVMPNLIDPSDSPRIPEIHWVAKVLIAVGGATVFTALLLLEIYGKPKPLMVPLCPGGCETAGAKVPFAPEALRPSTT